MIAQICEPRGGAHFGTSTETMVVRTLVLEVCMSGKGLSGVEDGSAPSPRLCHLIKWPDFDGYGFNLHAEKAKTGQYIGKVDADSPAQLAGLREGDRIIEVNLVNISNENHRQVVERIKSIPNETKLLVIDETADKWYKENKVIVKSTQSNVVHYKTPVPRPLNDNNNAVDDNNDRNDTQPNHLNPAADVSAGLSGVEDGSAPSPRLCHLIKWPDFDGYGFNLHAEKAKTGQYIGKVDADSPAQLAGLREGDRIIEVNLVNISNENHRQVVERIKSIPNETKLLVIDETADKWYKENKVIVKSTQSNVVHYKTPVPRPLNDNNNAVDDNNDRNDTQPNHLNPAADVSAVEVVDVANGLQNGDNDSHSTVESIPMKADIEVIDIKTNGSVNAVNGNDRKDSLG
ncbi:unnamed protein product [Medioppia subpectinata]|uniref:PDZ domain-containing protein n=1 Tax=Medioppia subpectinata TaxID=1979941 RepID=A0A7R9KSG8_9ACAR|nr:unnamed protein product [Medioppia subpectinata]CAG2109009.1 unnamed protein product [Medioppia subpectinata]